MTKTVYVVTREIAEALRKAREQQKKSQSRVARDLNASQTTIQKLEIGQAKHSSFVRELWLYYGLPPQRFDNIQTQGGDAQVVVVGDNLTPAQLKAEANNHQIAQLADVEELSDAALGQLVRKITREELVRVVDGQVSSLLQHSHGQISGVINHSQPAEIAIRLVRGNGTEVKIVLKAALAQELAHQILRRTTGERA